MYSNHNLCLVNNNTYARKSNSNLLKSGIILAKKHNGPFWQNTLEF